MNSRNLVGRVCIYENDIVNYNLPMSNDYNHKEIEAKWQKVWEEKELFQKTYSKQPDKSQKKIYLLFAFPYPSGEGLHVGHVESKTALDILARYYRMNNYAVFFPVGWDAFGLPAENYAVKTGVHPAETTRRAIRNFSRQIKRIGISYDWATEIATSHPEYYRWTQWLFLQMYKKGLAYKDLATVNWCPACNTVLANEQVVDGKCERCGSQVTQKDLNQWFFGITKYKDELIEGLKQVDWPEHTKQRQLNWIGKKSGIEISYEVEGTSEKISCFTTRPDTNFGATFIVLAPEHPFAQKVASGELSGVPNSKEVRDYILASKKKTELERQQDGRVKTGAFTGYYAVNNLNGRKMPIWVSDFVLGGFGTGAVVGVPAHDLRDFEFAKAFDLEIIRVVIAGDGDDSPVTEAGQVQEDNGTMINSDFLNGLDIHTATEKVMDYLEEKGWGKRVDTYKLRDWLVGRQRYWGPPIPVVYDPEGNAHPVKDEHLPWILPTDVDFLPTGESPLRLSKEFKERVERLYGKGWTPEYDTMDTFVDSSWYFLRFVDPRNTGEFASSDSMKAWLPVDFYMIGAEHTVLHLLYSRFFTKFLRDEGYLDFDEPFVKMRHQGMILGPDNKKMSKSKGNVINPDEIIDEFGADTLRMYEMFMGPIDADKPWDTNGVAGIRKFLTRVWRLANNPPSTGSSSGINRSFHRTIKKVTNDIQGLKYNTAIAKLMEFINEWEKSSEGLSRDDLSKFIRLLAPFTPFICEELWSSLGYAQNGITVHQESWPTYDESLVKEDVVNIVVQVNGKVRGNLTGISVEESQENIEKLAKELATKYTVDKEIIKTIYVPNKIVNFVVK